MKIRKLKYKVDLDETYSELIAMILTHPKVQEMDQHLQHADVTVLTHSLHVSYMSYRVSKFLNLDSSSVARGGLLHDFFLYDWHQTKPDEGYHAFVHTKIALRNASEHFVLNGVEEDIIVKHMWPVTIKPPRHAESFLISFIDKYCALSETYQFYSSKLTHKMRKNTISIR